MGGLCEADRDFCNDMWIKYEPEIHKLCNYKLQSCPDEIEDVVADTFFCLCKFVFNGNRPHNPHSWLLAVANNLIKGKYTEMNKERRKKVSFDEDTLEHRDLYVEYDFDYENVPDSVIDARKEAVKSQLDEIEQDLFTLAYDKNLKMKEIAQTMNLTVNAVKQRNYRLRKKICLMVKDCTGKSA